MPEIVIDNDLAQLINETDSPVKVVDRAGNLVGHVRVSRLTPERIKELEKRLDSLGPWLTSEQVFDYLRSLEAMPCNTK